MITVILCAYFTFDTFQRLDQIEKNPGGKVMDKYDKYFYSSKEMQIDQAKSDWVIKRGVFLNLATLSVGTFSFITIGKLQSRKEEFDEAKGKKKYKA